jgi:hypothetical protein
MSHSRRSCSAGGANDEGRRAGATELHQPKPTCLTVWLPRQTTPRDGSLVQQTIPRNPQAP